MAQQPPSPPLTDAEELRRRRRGRNWAIILVLAGLCALFYAITVVKMMRA
jgi:fatty acid desaturase